MEQIRNVPARERIRACDAPSSMVASAAHAASFEGRDYQMTYDDRDRDMHTDTAPENEEGGTEAVGAGAGAIGGALVGGAVAGPPGALVGGAIGAVGGALAGESTEGDDEAGAATGGADGRVGGAIIGGAGGRPGLVVTLGGLARKRAANGADRATDQCARRAGDRAADQRAADGAGAGADGLRAALFVLRGGVRVHVAISIVVRHLVVPSFEAGGVRRRRNHRRRGVARADALPRRDIANLLHRGSGAAARTRYQDPGAPPAGLCGVERGSSRDRPNGGYQKSHASGNLSTSGGRPGMREESRG